MEEEEQPESRLKIRDANERKDPRTVIDGWKPMGTRMGKVLCILVFHAKESCMCPRSIRNPKQPDLKFHGGNKIGWDFFILPLT